MKIIFETHATSVDNEAGLASGWNDANLSLVGEKQAVQLFERRKNDNLAAVYCSDLQRSYKSAEAFKTLGIPVIKDNRLRELNYGDMNGTDTATVSSERIKRIKTPFPKGGSYADCMQRFGEFLNELPQRHSDGDTILIVGHRATQYGLDHHILGIPLKDCVTKTFVWQPGWEYTYILK